MPRYKGHKTRRKYENARVKKLGFRNYSQYQNFRKDPQVRRLTEELAEFTGEKVSDLKKSDSYLSRALAKNGKNETIRRFASDELRDEVENELQDLPQTDIDFLRGAYPEAARRIELASIRKYLVA